ncbi:hypothetical protein JK176_07585 [Gluconobacter sp. Dm-73]|uniref:hypothetical protein n=1 Tax=Gluconobacter sp. Dm-73 TaxID=2799802 RepID=UPI001B8C9FD5|nr:hypothetical protein [Gluconobacter sp. Dm-73]MBS1074741.1 hypothetical protein [Gluconobacter sp. Dm-73]
MSLLLGQGAMLVLVTASVRGNRILCRNSLTDLQRNILKSCAAAVLTASLVLRATSSDFIILNIIEWILLAGPEIMVATLLCSWREQRSRS